jgi:hypothetical protein
LGPCLRPIVGRKFRDCWSTFGERHISSEETGHGKCGRSRSQASYAEGAPGIRAHLREDIPKVDELQVMAIFETSLEVLAGLKKTFKDYEQKSGAAWRLTAGRAKEEVLNAGAP